MSVLWAVFGAAPVSAGGDAPSGALYVTSLPSGAEIWLDGTYVGRDPVLLDGLRPGVHSMAALKPGWLDRETDVRVTAGQTVMSSLHLMPGPRGLAGGASGTLVVRNAPAGSRLEIDGTASSADAGKGVDVPVGPHHVTIAEAHASETRFVTIFPDTTTDVVFSKPKADDVQAPIVAPAEDYLPTNNFALERKTVTIRYAGHFVVADLGNRNVRVDRNNVVYDEAPILIGHKLYLPLALLEMLSGDTSNGSDR